MARLRPPPGEFTQTPDIIAIPAGTTFLRLSRRVHGSSLYFGRAARFRWDAPDSRFGVLYAGTAFAVCVAETVARPAPDAPLDAATGVKILSESSDLRPYDVYRITTKRPLMLAAMFGATFQRLGIDSVVLTTRDYAGPQAWARWLHEHPRGFDGLQYVSRLLGDVYISETDLWDACVSTFVGAWVLVQNVAHYGPSWEAVGAYNAGQKDTAAAQANRARYIDRVKQALSALSGRVERPRFSGNG